MLKGKGSPAQPNEDACEFGAQLFLLFAFDVAEHGPGEGPNEHGEYFLEGEHQGYYLTIKNNLTCFITYFTLMGHALCYSAAALLVAVILITF